MARYLREVTDKHPSLREPDTDAPHGKEFAKKTLGKAIRDLYSPAQLDVMKRVSTLLETRA